MPGSKFIFLDRDGVINEFPGPGGYVTDWKKFRFIPKSAEAIALLSRAGFEIAVISNQGGVSKGLMTSEDLKRLTRQMLEAVKKKGGKIAGVFYCEHQTSDRCDCKKPKPALFYRAIGGRAADWKSIFFIGDSREDILAGKALGCKTLMVLTGRLKEKDIPALPAKPDAVKKDLWEAARWIIQKKY
ncbi:MAG: HAD-IIIA family hydrolase [Candidatus Omnitrophica bacterium]|nr:HAD-IIIA family hydrolase [Candidatus Omnitrophota bacterium]